MARRLAEPCQLPAVSESPEADASVDAQTAQQHAANVPGKLARS